MAVVVVFVVVMLSMRNSLPNSEKAVARSSKFFSKFCPPSSFPYLSQSSFRELFAVWLEDLKL